MMRKTFKYRLFPTKSQVTKLAQSLDGCRWLYNHFLEQRKTSWENEKKSISRYDQINSIPELKKEHEFLNEAFSQSLQDIAVRIDLAFRAFFRRVKAGEKPGYPRFRGKFRYDSFTYPQAGFKLLDDAVRLSKIGRIRTKLHRPTEGQIKTCTVRRSPTGKWYITFSCVIDHVPDILSADPAIGIDMGLESFATFSDGDKIHNPRFFKQEEKTIATAQRKLSKQEKGTAEREKAKKIVCRIHERISNKRSDFAHKLSHKLVNQYQVIAFEKLNIKQMQENGFKGIRKSISDVAWNQFMQFTTYKAVCAGRTVIFVNPRNTSKMCSRCGQIVEKTLADRVHRCSCGLILDRDENAAINILSLGLQGLGLAPGSRLL